MADKLYGRGVSGQLYDFNAWNPAGQVYKPSALAFVDWLDAEYALYRIPAVEKGTSGQFYSAGEAPAGASHYTMCKRGASLDLSRPPIGGGTIDSYARPAYPEFTGSIEWPVTVRTKAGVLMADVEVIISSDVLGLNVVGHPLYTNAAGIVKPKFDAPGTYYGKPSKEGHEFETSPFPILVYPDA